MKRNVPKLRFNSFEDEWDDKSLGQLLEFKNGVNADKDSYGKGVKFINVLDVLNNNYITYDNIIGFVDIDDKTLEKYNVSYGDVLFQRSSETREEVGTANVYLDNKVVTFGGFVIRGKKIAEYNPSFMNSLLKSSSARKEITTKSGGSTRYNVGQEILSSVIVKMPSLQEQEKISNFLTKVDSLIEEQTGKVTDLEKYKKGMMQKIFSQEIRFKDDNGCEYPKWEEKRLGSISDVRDGTHDSPKYTEEGFPLITSKNLCSNGKINFENINYISKEAYININKRSVVNVGDILFGMIGTIGNPVIVDRDGFAIKNVALIKEVDILKNKFLIHFLSSNLIDKQFYKLNSGGTQKFIALNLIRNLEITLPCLEEQTKIAKFLSNIDTIIEEEKGKLEDLIQWKKGLLQQMFV